MSGAPYPVNLGNHGPTRTLDDYLAELGERLDDLPLSAPDREALVKRIAEIDAEIMARAGL